MLLIEVHSLDLSLAIDSLLSKFNDINYYAGTMAQLFEVGNEECSVILLWTYSAAAIALTAWSTFLLWLLS